jgi:spore coat polysaccharide biosynthesis protein SpsF
MSQIMIIIQARMTSTRLPGKVLLPIGNKPALEIMIDRLGSLRDNVIIATTNDGSEAPIIDLCNNLDIRYFQGDTENVLERYYLCAKHFGAKANTGIMRLTSDCPLIDVDLTKEVISTFENNHYDMVSLGPHSGFPRGLDACIFSFDKLENTYNQASLANDKEHVTLGMAKFNHLNCYNISALEDLSHYRLTVDEADDYKLITEIYRLFDYRTDFTYQALIQLLKSNPHLNDINKHVEQKKA